MQSTSKDARVRELQFLANLDRTVSLDLEPKDMPAVDKSMIAELIYKGYLNGVGTLAWTYQYEIQAFHVSRPENNNLFLYAERERWNSINRLLGGQRIRLEISHAGRVRVSELEQALQAGRDRDPTGFLWSKRHLDRDLAIAVLSARPEFPLSVCFLDMNGLKLINDQLGHAAGDAAIKAYVRVVSMICGDGIEGYRGDGGDEVVLIVRGTNTDHAFAMLRNMLLKLADERVEGVTCGLTASCGIAMTVNPSDDGGVVKDRADKAQYRAKKESSSMDPRPSVIVIEDGKPQVVGKAVDQHFES